MEYVLSCLLLVVVLFALLGSGTWIAVSLMGVGVVTMSLFSPAPIGKVMATTIWGQSNSWELAALPMFIWMGEILTRSRLSQDMFRGLVPWIGWLPGRLIHFNVIGSGVFAAASGSSAATTVTIGKMSMPELLRRGYDEKMSTGSLAGASTLGFLIPPSIILIVYGVATEQSIARLFIAGILPGIMLVGMFSGYVVLWAILNPDKTPTGAFRWATVVRSRRIMSVIGACAGVVALAAWGTIEHTVATSQGVLFGALGAIVLSLIAIQPMPVARLTAGIQAFISGTVFRIRESIRLIPVLILIVGILGSIYQGIASPTDAAAVGVFVSLILSWLSGTMDLKTFWLSLMSATRIACMLAFMLAGASFLSVAMGFAGIPRDLATWIGSLDLSPAMLLAALTIFYVVLGCFLDGISIVILSTAVILPMIENAGIDTIWFGIYLVIVVEMSQITPPVGINLFILQALTERDLLYVARATMPFFFILVAAVALLTAYPDIALFLPERMAARAGG